MKSLQGYLLISLVLAVFSEDEANFEAAETTTEVVVLSQKQKCYQIFEKLKENPLPEDDLERHSLIQKTIDENENEVNRFDRLCKKAINEQLMDQFESSSSFSVIEWVCDPCPDRLPEEVLPEKKTLLRYIGL
ncbi:unnamed protein product [Bursaphelenchus xylophilus]|uniref:(pine wood nematode) hypothetical protein n=1 Tax=Bursaphelenchus xylophilus TaxID=6326 RepID=A0A1I7SRZ0_BURXY|nr:unnamed protein product [Bursaphelenchus xylophilus]CAG9101693.1 unnamed protein product [Bursaphelenchus xylophilus]